jgi:nicotinate-nucleotide adenylyltransferase
MGQIGMFGGTFDPIHQAHITIATLARDRFALDRVLLIPAANPPHKQSRITEDWVHRYNMVELACRGYERLEACALESGQETSYSIATIERLRAQISPEDRLLFLIGADAFSEIATWYRWQDVVAALEFIVVTRPGHVYETPEGARVHPLEGVNLQVSSSRIREMLARCAPPEELSPLVFDYIRAHRLYGFGSACAETPG